MKLKQSGQHSFNLEEFNKWSKKPGTFTILIKRVYSKYMTDIGVFAARHQILVFLETFGFKEC
jgi:hypothetical protein